MTDEDILNTAASFVGVQDQFPPAHSAIKIGGERVYEKARRGEEVELKARRVEIMEFDVEKIELPKVYFRIKCSKGTYIRSIAHDFGKKLNCGGHLSSLRRTKSGDFDVKNAWELTELINQVKELKNQTV